ncbi:MAG: NAD-dependent protein deacetylase [Bacteroidales bacterium]
MIAKEKIELLKEKINNAEAIIVGGASGMSAASGFRFYYQRDEVFSMIAGTLEEKYGFHNFFDALYDRQHTRGEHWAMLLRANKYIYECETGVTYTDLAELLKNKNYYIATTNQDAQFSRVFPDEKITSIQGDWRYWQCKSPCHDKIYDNKEQVFELCKHIENDSLPDELIPRCPHCGKEMDAWVRSHTFLQGDYYQKEMDRYYDFLRNSTTKRTLFLELGVGMMTPMFIKEPFMNMVNQWPNAFYATINPQHAIVPKQIASKSLAIDDDIAITLRHLLGKPIDDLIKLKSDVIFNPSRVY